MQSNLEKSQALEASLAAEDSAPVVETPQEQAPIVPEVEQPKAPELSTEAKQAEQVERKVYSIPLDKHNKQLENAKRIADEERAQIREQARAEALAELKAAPAQAPQTDDEIKQFAEEFGVDENVVAKLVDIATKRSPKAQEIPKDWQEEMATMKQQREIAAAKQQFSTDFEASVLPLIQKENPNVTSAQIQEIKNSIDELAFSDKYNRYELADIFKIKKDDYNLKPIMGIEPSRGGNRNTVDFSEVTPAEIKKMTPQEAEAYFKWEDSSKGGSRYSK